VVRELGVSATALAKKLRLSQPTAQGEHLREEGEENSQRKGG